MEEVFLNEAETRYYGDLFLCCDEEKTGKIPMLKATELFRSANTPNDKILEIMSLAGIPSTALHISRAQFYSCLKLIAVYQVGMLPLRQELIASSIQLPLPRFNWTDNNVFHTPPPPPPPPLSSAASTSKRRNSLQRRNEWLENHATLSNHHHQHQDCSNNERVVHSDMLSTDSEVDQCESSYGDEKDTITLNKTNAGSNVMSLDMNLADKNIRSTHRIRSGGGSPEAWSTNSDSPTPTNSIAERPWVVKESLWHGLLGDEHRQLLGTEEESSDRHSSEEENETDLEAVYQITPEQREYYYKQFKLVQHDNNGLLSGHVARVFFEKSRIPVDELRHIWQLCDVTRDGALSLTEFIAAMHLVVLRRNNIPLPATLPSCLHPNIIQYTFIGSSTATQEPPEADLLHLNDDDETIAGSGGTDGVDDDEDKTDNTIIGSTISLGTGGSSSGNATNSRLFSDKNIMNTSTMSTSSKTSIGSRHSVNTAGVGNACCNINNVQKQNVSPVTKNSLRSTSNSPKVIEMLNVTPPIPPPPPPPSSLILTSTTGISVPTTIAIATTTALKNKDHALWTVDTPSSQWTKFTESPISNVSSPGPKPLNFDMQRTAQAVVSDPQILHPVPLRVTPVGGNIVNNSSSTAGVTAVSDKINGDTIGDNNLIINEGHSPKSNILAFGGVSMESCTNINNNNHNSNTNYNIQSSVKNNNSSIYRDFVQNSENLRAIQRPQAKKLPSKNIGALPPPPQRESNIGNSTAAPISTAAVNDLSGSGGGNINSAISTTTAVASTSSYLINKKEPPPLPPPRPSHRHHGRSSSLDLNKFKIITNGNQGQEITAQTSFDLQTSSAFADFTQFSDNNNDNSFKNNVTIEDSQQQQQQLHSLQSQATQATTQQLTRVSLQSNQRVSAFEVYRKPHTPCNSLSPQQQATIVEGGNAGHAPQPFGSAAAAAMTILPNAEQYERRVNAISETLRHVSFKQDNNNLNNSGNNSMTDVLKHLREQNHLLMRLCNDLSDELLTVQTRKEEMRLKLEACGTLPPQSHSLSMIQSAAHQIVLVPPSNYDLSALSIPTTMTTQHQGNNLIIRTGSSISAPVTANITGGSGSSGVHSNV